jgi:hypothetical protein
MYRRLRYAVVAAAVVTPLLGASWSRRGASESPACYMAANLIDDRRGIVLLLFSRETFAFVENKSRLAGGLPLLWLGNRRDEPRAASVLNDLLRRLASLIELPVAPRICIGRVQYGTIEERIGHSVLGADCVR